MNNALIFIIDTVFDIVCFLFLARLILQLSKADFYNPISQGIVKATDPVVKPLRTIIPMSRRLGNLDIASLLVAWLVKVIAYALLFTLDSGSVPGIFYLMIRGLFDVLSLILTIYWFALIFVIVLSFLAPATYHPGALLLRQVTEPILAPARRLIPPLGGLDFSPILVFMALILARDFLLPELFNALLS